MAETVLSGRRRAPGDHADHRAHLVALVVALVGILLTAALASSGVVTLPSAGVVTEAETPSDAAIAVLALVADTTPPSVIAPPGTGIALHLESAGRALDGVAPSVATVVAPVPVPAAPVPVPVPVPAAPAPAPAAVLTGPVPPPVPRRESLTVPVQGAEVSSGFGYRVNPMGGSGAELHTGIDYAVACGSTVVAADGGTVTEAGWHAYGGGQRIVVDHGDGVSTTYNHLGALGVAVGQPVNGGESIGAVGSTGNSTGCHLHFEVMVGDVKVDPQPWL